VASMSSGASISRKGFRGVAGARPGGQRAAAMRVMLALAAAAVPLVLPSAASAIPPDGALFQLPAPNECVSEPKGKPVECQTTAISDLNATGHVAVSPDGLNVYTTSAIGIVEFSRNPANGALTEIGCFQSSPGECAESESHGGVTAVDEAEGVAVSPDGANVYVVSKTASAVVEFSRSQETGLLKLEGCITHEALVEACTPKAKGLAGARGVVVTSDGKNVYVTGGGEEAIAEFSREAGTGVLKQLEGGNECIGGPKSECAANKAIGMAQPVAAAVPPDGASLYVASEDAKTKEGDVAAFERDTASGVLTRVAGKHGCVSQKLAACEKEGVLQSPEDLVVSADGTTVYATSRTNNAVEVLHREVSALKHASCLMRTSGAKECTEIEGVLSEPDGLALSPEAETLSPGGEDLYVSARGDKALDVFKRNAAEEGKLTPLAGEFDCVTHEASGCGANKLVALEGPVGLAVSPDATNVYAADFTGNALEELGRTLTPTVSGLNPHFTSEAGGRQITVNGNGFITGATVSFGGKPGSAVIVNSASSITVTTPAGVGAVHVTVTTSAGTSATSEHDQLLFDFVPPHLLGGLNTTGYCEGLGYHGTKGEPAKLKKGAVEGPEFAIENWACEDGIANLVVIKSAGPPPSENDMCRVEYPGKASFAYAEEINSAFSWACYESPPITETPAEKPKATITKTPSPEGPPAPVLAKTGNLAPVSGRVLVQLPGTHTFVPLASLRQIPFGTIIDATHGRVSVTTAGPHGGTQTGEFFLGQFILTQGRSGLVVATLNGGDFAVCPTARERAHRARASARHTSGKHAVRKLWANAHGSFSTKGNYAAGAVQGTEWLTEDLCEGTLIRVTRDKVKVTDLVRHRSLTVKAGRRHLAKAP
jgi:DNA-binding beta-propeller fold protein YncE